MTYQEMLDYYYANGGGPTGAMEGDVGQGATRWACLAAPRCLATLRCRCLRAAGALRPLRPLLAAQGLPQAPAALRAC